jgi:L-lactate dehydrogenase complex protein LldG
VVALAVSAAREEMLRRVRSALADAHREGGAPAPVERRYRRVDEAPRAAIVERFAERVAEYRATVRRCSASELPGALEGILAERQSRRVGVPPGLPAEWRPEGLDLVGDQGLSTADLDGLDAALTGCALGIAETGTIVLDGGARSGRRALTLVPDHHVCVVEESQVVGLVPEALERLAPVARAGRPLTFVSGPSATSDIELSRVEGVHGPRLLDVLVVGERSV